MKIIFLLQPKFKNAKNSLISNVMSLILLYTKDTHQSELKLQGIVCATSCTILCAGQRIYGSIIPIKGREIWGFNANTIILSYTRVGSSTSVVIKWV